VKRAVYLLYGASCYLVSLATVLYAIGFVEAVFVPRSVDAGGPRAPWGSALLVDSLLLAVFAVQHSGMARPGFKARWTRLVPEALERSTYILFTSACLIALFVFWRPIPRLLWTVEATGFRAFLLAVSILGWFIALFSTFLIDHFDLFGLRQVYLTAKNKAPAPLRFRTPVLYRLVRHPLYLGFILAFWAAPTMTLGHLVFSLATLGYIVVAIQFEERDLLVQYGDQYAAYRLEVRGLVPLPKLRPRAAGNTPRLVNSLACHKARLPRTDEVGASTPPTLRTTEKPCPPRP
jgi:methanethiol S-methyltransferase